MADKLGIIAGVSFDLTIDDDDGEPWDFSVEAKRIKAEKIIRVKKALLLIGSPMCTAFSRLQKMNIHRMSKDDASKMVQGRI